MLQNIPTFTKLYLTSSILLTILTFIKIVDPYSVTYTFKQTFLELCLWRPFTALLYLSRANILLPFHLLFGYIAILKFEVVVYEKKRYADMVWFILLSMIGLMIFSTIFSNLYFYGNSLIVIILIAWAQKAPNDFIPFFVFDIKSLFFQIIYPILMSILGSNYINYMAGVVVGILLTYLKNPEFLHSHRDYFPTPQFLKNLLRINQQVAPMPVHRQQRQQQPLKREKQPRIQRNVQLPKKGQYFIGKGSVIG